VLEISTVDYHTAGEPFRIVTGGAPDLSGSTVLDRRENAASPEIDRIRRLLVHEPRGHADMYGCFVTPPDDERSGRSSSTRTATPPRAGTALSHSVPGRWRPDAWRRRRTVR
jgi:proline racemase